MTSTTTRRIARIAGPAAIALAATEALNMDIYAAQAAPVVYLNGTLLFVAGVAIVQAHNRWRPGAALLVTLTGWGVAALGLFRMIAPAAPQASEGLLTAAIFTGLFGLGAALSFVGYQRAP